MGELRNRATRRSGSRVFRTSLEARSEVEKKTALVVAPMDQEILKGFLYDVRCAVVMHFSARSAVY